MKKKKKNFTIEKATGLTTQEIKALIKKRATARDIITAGVIKKSGLGTIKI